MFKKYLISIILCAILLQTVSVVANQKKNIVCYYGSWSTYHRTLGKSGLEENINPFLCTHLIYASLGVQETGELRISDSHLDLENNYGRGNVSRFNALKLRNSSLKTIISVGGWDVGSKKFSIIAADPVKRARFLQSVIQFIQRHEFDGLDLEYPNQCHSLTNNDHQNFLIWLRELKEGFEPLGYTLSVAVGSAKFPADMSYNIPEMAKYLDLINVMAYDLYGPWDSVTNDHLYSGPLDVSETAKQLNFNATAQYWIKQGAPRDKLVMGVSFYGPSFTLADPNNHNVGAPHIGRGMAGQYSIEPGVIGYNELCELFKNQSSLWNQKWEPNQLVAFAYSQSQWVGYENERSIALKANYVYENNLGGIMIWFTESDDFRGVSSQKLYPLLTLINEVLHESLHPDAKAKNPEDREDESIIPSRETNSTYDICSGINGYVRDPKNCGKFYICNNGNTFEFACPSSLYFDLEISACNYANLVKCNSHN